MFIVKFIEHIITVKSACSLVWEPLIKRGHTLRWCHVLHRGCHVPHIAALALGDARSEMTAHALGSTYTWLVLDR